MRRSKSSDPSFRYTNNMSRIPVSTIHGACHWCGSRNHYLGAWAQVHQTSGKGRCDCPYIVVGMSYEESREHVRKSALAGGDGELGMGQCRLITPQTNALILPKNFITDGCLAKLAGWKCPTEADPNYAVPAKPQQRFPTWFGWPKLEPRKRWKQQPATKRHSNRKQPLRRPPKPTPKFCLRRRSS